MPLSYSEESTLTCPDCGADFSATVWLVVDAQEQPEQVAALRQGRLNIVACPNCGSSGPAGAPLLFHDRAARQVIFAAAPGAAEHEWREQARELHALLVGSIPEEDRRSYLGDVQVAQDVPGIVRLLDKAARRSSRQTTAGADRDPPAPAPVAPPPSPPDSQGDEEIPPLLAAVQSLLAADTPADLRAVIAAHAVLLDTDTDTVLSQLADVALEQREYEIAEGLQKARQLLANVRAANAGVNIVAPPDPQVPIEELLDAVYQPLLQVGTSSELMALVQDHPFLLDPRIGALLATHIEQALEEGNERLAQSLEERCEALAFIAENNTLRVASEERPPETPDSPLADAIEALLTAEGEEAMARVLDTYPELLTDEAQAALWEFAAEARAGGDEEMAAYAVECRAMLRQVREGLEGEEG